MDSLSLFATIGLFLLSIFAGGNASIVGFGIGSFLTPVYALAVGTNLAVVAVAIPHFIGTLFRFWLLKSHVNKRVLKTFGMTSAIGGLFGAWLHTWFGDPVLSKILGCLLILAGVFEMTGILKRVQLGKKTALGAGLLSGAFGGLVGNQGGIRAAALLTFNIPKEQFIATSTVVALMIDAARLPIYLTTQGSQILEVWKAVVILTCGVVIGTFLGRKLLNKIPRETYRKVVAILIIGLGIFLVFKS